MDRKPLFDYSSISASIQYTEIRLTEMGHDLYLHLYDPQGHHVGLRSIPNVTGCGLTGVNKQVESNISGAEYLDLGNGTIIINLPNNVSFISFINPYPKENVIFL